MKNFIEAENIMVDLETLSDNPDAAILSIGACAFRFNSGGKPWKNTFYVNVDPKDCKKYGLTVSKDTVEWWSKQSKEVRQSFVEPPPVDLKTALEGFTAWTQSISSEFYLWSNGAAFDAPILEIAYRNVGLKKPWHYRNVMCFRTVCNISGVNSNKLRSEDKMLHNALIDAGAQAEILMGIFDDPDIPF